MTRSMLALAFSALTATIGLGQDAAFSDRVHRTPDVMVPARDGTLLATDIYRPAGHGAPVDGRRPVLLQRTPYNKRSERFVEHAVTFVEHGYVVALQDMRGRFASEGTFRKYHRFDAPDGYDTIEWLAKQDFSDGRVAMWGTSYGAHTQADAAKLNPPSLVGLILNQGGMANAWDHAVRHGGAFELGRELTWAFRQIPVEVADETVRKAFAESPVTDWYAALPLREGLSPLSLAPNFESYFLDELTHADDDELWHGIGLRWDEYYEQTADVPMLHIGGWYDIFLRGTIQSYAELSRLKSSPMRLLIGPWSHSGNARTYAGDVDFGDDAALEDFHTDFHLRWFEQVFAGDVEAETPVRLFIMGGGDGTKDAEGRLRHGGYWRDVDEWPLPDTQHTPHYLRADGSLTVEPPREVESATTYTFDPRHPVPTLGGTVSSRLRDGAFDQRERADFPGSRPPYLPLSARSDVLVFQTPPLEADVEVTGPIEVRLFVRSTAVDTDFTAKLIDVYPPSEDFPSGFHMNLTDAMIRASYRDGRRERELIEPGEVYELVIRPFATANVFKKGHRIRLDISSSNFPRFDVNPNTGEPLGRNRRWATADNTVIHDRAHPSHVVLPLQR